MKKTTDSHGFEVPDQQEPQAIFNADAQIEKQLSRGITVQAAQPKPQVAPPPAAPAAQEEPLPDDLPTCFALLKKASDEDVESEINADGQPRQLPPQEIKKRKACLDRIRLHLFRLQQGVPPMRPITWEEISSSHTSKPERVSCLRKVAGL